jgi:hypothetical protein
MVEQTEMVKDQLKRTENFDAMTPDLKKVAKRFDGMLEKASTGTVKIAYDMGTTIKDVVGKETKYGSNAVKQLAMHLGKEWSDTKLYAYRDFATTWSRAQIEKLSTSRMADGSLLTVSHFLAVAKIKSTEDRKVLWNKIFKESLSAVTVRAEVQAAFEQNNTRTGGRKPSRPASLMSGAQEITKMVGRVNNKFEIWDETVIDEAQNKSAPECTEELLERLTEAEAVMDTAENNFMQYRPKLQAAIDRVQNVVAENKKTNTAQKSADTRKATGNAAPAKKKADKKPAAKQKVAKKVLKKGAKKK